MLFGIILRATVLVIAGYFVWFASSKAEDRIKNVGKYLAMWTFAFAVLYVIGSIAAPHMGGRFGAMAGHGGMGRMGMHRGMGGGMGGRGGMMGMHHGFMNHGGMGGHFRHHDGAKPADGAAATTPATPGTTAPAAAAPK